MSIFVLPPLSGDYTTTCVTLNWILKTSLEMPDMCGLFLCTAGVGGRHLSRSSSLAEMIGSGSAGCSSSTRALQKDQVHEALVTMALALAMQGDFHQSMDYVEKLSDRIAASLPEGASSGAISDSVGLLSDFIVCCNCCIPHLSLSIL